MNETEYLNSPRQLGIENLRAAGLPETLGDLWVAEAMVDGNGVTTYHVAQLADVLEMNELQVRQGWSSGYVPFALCRTVDEAHDACEQMRRQQAAGAELNVNVAVRGVKNE
ncbi:MAG TPA: hypothetical protein PLU87_18410 [Sedimentisphaerales bacterium]|nr:hypothetical protein [Sedimentisphaerales bacterium]HRS13010.1 hypothetical protein [Sedimentisphaerales bacterium]HRV49643.1 hypothetical protein [Sedimentisphaerales bacterium]